MSEAAVNTGTDLHNPFVKDRYHLNLLSMTRYPSTPDCRVVWAKGRASEVPPERTTKWCPRWKYDTVIFVWTDPRRLPVFRLAGLLTQDDIPISFRMELIAKPAPNPEALRDVALHYDDKLEVLRVIARRLMATAVRLLELDKVRTGQAGQREELQRQLNELSRGLALPLEIVDIFVELEETPLEKASQERLRGALANQAQRDALAGQQKLALLEAEGQLALMKAIHEQRGLDLKLVTAVSKVRTDIERQHIKTMEMLEALSPTVLIAAHRDHPEIARALTDLEAARVANDTGALARAFDQVTTLLAAVTRSVGNLVQQPPAISISQSK